MCSSSTSISSSSASAAGHSFERREPGRFPKLADKRERSDDSGVTVRVSKRDCASLHADALRVPEGVADCERIVSLGWFPDQNGVPSGEEGELGNWSSSFLAGGWYAFARAIAALLSDGLVLDGFALTGC